MRIRSRALSLVLLSSGLIAMAPNPGSAWRVGGGATVTPFSPTAGGDTCAAATPIPSLPFNDSGDTTGAVDNIRLTGCMGFLSMPGPDHIYSFNVFSGNNLTFTLTPTTADYDPSIYVRTACTQGSGTCVARTDVGNSGQAETITVNNLSPGTYYFFVDSVWAKEEVPAQGGYTLSVTGTLGTPNNTSFFTLTPCRILDTRDPVGPLGGPALAAGSIRNFTITGQCSIPVTAKSVSFNATVTGPTSPGHLILFPGGAPLPLTSTLNFRTMQTRANNAIVPLGAGGILSVADGQSSGTVHFILDVNGYFE